jgi:hypothetical protein
MPKDITKIRCPHFEHTVDEKLPVKGNQLLANQTEDLVHRLYFSSIVLGKTGSGKTIMLNHLVKNTIDKDTVVFVFSGSIYQDKVWKDLIKWFKAKKIKHVLFENIIENGVNNLEAVIQEINALSKNQDDDDNDNDAPQQEPEKPKNVILYCNQTEKNDEGENKHSMKPRRKKYRTPRFLFLIDDQSKADLRNTDSLANFLKSSRHKLARVYVLTQSVHDIDPKAYTQSAQLIIFNGFSMTWMHALWKKLTTHLSFKEFWNLYQVITKPKYSFLNIHLRENKYRQNFGKLIPL